MKALIDRLRDCRTLPGPELQALLTDLDESAEEYLFEQAREVREAVYGRDVYMRGLIEFTNYCKNDCYYCGIRCGNRRAVRYRLTEEQILSCCATGYALGFRTFVLQGGEDPYFTDERICAIVSAIKERYPDCAVTLSIGEKEAASYRAYYEAGADRYLLRHETADCGHYARLHPPKMRFEHRMQCLQTLKAIGFQTGCGLMVGSPFQTPEMLVQDLVFMRDFKPHMVGIGPFIPHRDTPFAAYPAGSLQCTLRLLAIVRLMLPNVLLPSTTALGTIHPNGRELGLRAGANVVMPNLSPVEVRKLYELYDDKICTGEEAAQCRGCLERRVESAGYRLVAARGDFKDER